MYPRREALLARTPGMRPYQHVLNANIIFVPLSIGMFNVQPQDIIRDIVRVKSCIHTGREIDSC